MAPATDKAAAPKGATPEPTVANNNNGLGCIKCGRDISESDAFCIYCGTKVSVSLAQHKKADAPAAKPAAAPKPSSASASAAKKPEGKAPAPASTSTSASASTPASSSSKVVSADALKKEQSARGRAPAKPAAAKSEAKPEAKAAAAKPPTSAPSQGSAKATPSAAPRSEPRREPRGVSPSTPNFRSSEDMDSRGSLDASPSDVAGLEKLWVPDNFSTDCMDCQNPFGFGKRRHHCRVCGLLFCRDCVKNKAQVPTSFGYGTAPQRCCRSCVRALQLKAITAPADVFAQRRGGVHKKAGHNDSHYDVLGVAKDASPEEITRQYNAMARKMDPSSKEDLDKLEKITDAYRTLQDPAARERHDSQAARESNASDRPRNRKQSSQNDSFVAETARSDQTECQVCFRPFKLGRRQHHCRRCTRSVCNQCSEGQKPIVELGFPTPVRHCSSCMENPPKFVKPVMEPVTKPPPGFEYLSKLDILVDVEAVKNSSEDEQYKVRTFCEPNAEAAKQAGITISDSDRQVANEYAMTLTRSFSDFEWLVTALGDSTNPKALPNFPDKRTTRGGAVRAEMLQVFLYGCMLHPLLRDTDCLKAFLALPSEEFSKFKRGGPRMTMYETDNYSALVVSMRLELEKAQIRSKLNELINREAANQTRSNQQVARGVAHQSRESSQTVRRDQALARFKALEARKETQTERMAREKDRYMQQSNTTHILFFDTVRDESVRTTEETTRQKEKMEFTKSKDAFQADTVQWNRDMAEWSKHRADWSEAHNPPISKDIASEWLVKSYGIYNAASSSAAASSDVPRDLVEMYTKLAKMQKKEPALLEEEGNTVDDEWMKLAKEREHWTNDRANVKREDEMCADEDKRYEQEHEFVRLAAEARAKKVKAIEADLLSLKTEITSRSRCISQRRERHQTLDQEFENEWRVVQGERDTTTKARLEEHNARLTRGKKRHDIFKDQLARQAKSQRMLLFKRAALADERKSDKKLFGEHKEDCRTALSEARDSRMLTPEYIARIQADMKIRAEEYQAVKESNQRTAFEGGDKEVDERDEFMNDVRRRRAEFQKQLDDQKAQLDTENKLCTSLLKRMEEHIAKLDAEIANAAAEEKLINEFTELLAAEIKLLADEEAKRDEKKSHITELMNNAGNWVLDALHEHSKRKKKEADRLVNQAVRAADLQKLVQHFTHRVIEQEERIMRQKQRILNGEHKVEMLKSSENWFQYVTSFTQDLGKKDMKILETCKGQRVEDLKEASRLQKDDDTDMKGVSAELAMSRRFAKDKEEKRSVWAQIEDVYSVQKPQEKDEDMMMTSQIRSLLLQLGEAFEMLANRLLEEEESLHHASTQLEGEVESINAFMQRMESEENALCNTEKSSLAKETQVRRSETDLVEQRARSLIDNYKQMQAEHSKYPVELDKIKSRRNERERPVTPREAELEAAKKLMSSRNYYDRKACAEFVKRFKLDMDLKEVREVFDWLRVGYDRDIKKMERWLDASRKERKQMEVVNAKGHEVNWERDTLARIPALKDVQKKLARSEGKAGESPLHPSEQWIMELITLKKSISEIDSTVIKNVDTLSNAAVEEEKKVAATLQKMKTDKEYVLNSIRFIDQEEAKAVRATGKGSTRRTDSQRSSDDMPTPAASPSGSSSSRDRDREASSQSLSGSRGPRPPMPATKSSNSLSSSRGPTPSVSRPGSGSSRGSAPGSPPKAPAAAAPAKPAAASPPKAPAAAAPAPAKPATAAPAKPATAAPAKPAEAAPAPPAKRAPVKSQAVAL